MAKKTVKDIHGELESIVNILNSDVIKALDIKEAKKSLEKKVRQLINEEIELKEVVDNLKTTRDKLSSELNNKETEIKDLQDKIGALKNDRSQLESARLVLSEQIKNLKIEKAQMNKSLEKTNDLLVMLKNEITQFDEEIKS
ncbi:MAG: hypothetical protein JW754_04975 [Candidatus Aenigmarchaeota archaeon]|nr:hypothetical protein [Candidatus Aenigmarchaeota archaeon]